MTQSSVFFYPSLPFILLGVIVGIAFVTDGWRSQSSQNNNSFSKSPKIRGILYIISGAIISSITALLNLGIGIKIGIEDTDISEPVYSYLLGCTITILISLLALAIFAFSISFQKIRHAEPGSNLWLAITESFTFVIIALQDGIQRFLQEIDRRSERQYLNWIHQIEAQRDNTFEFFGAFFASLVANIDNEKIGLDNFLTFVDTYFLEFRRKLLYFPQRYRVGVYYLNLDQRQFLHVIGSSPLFAPHSGNPIPFDGSLAGFAHHHPHIPLIYVEDESVGKVSEQVIFYKRQAKHWYKSVIACSIKPPLKTGVYRQNLPALILCVDCVDNVYDSKDFEYIRKMITLLALAIADACLGMKVTDDEMKVWLQQQGRI